MEVLYHIRSYFMGMFPYIGLTYALYMVGTSNQSDPENPIDVGANFKWGHTGGYNPGSVIT